MIRSAFECLPRGVEVSSAALPNANRIKKNIQHDHCDKKYDFLSSKYVHDVPEQTGL